VVRTAGAVVVVVVGFAVAAAEGRAEVAPAVVRRNKPALVPAPVEVPAGLARMEQGHDVSCQLFCVMASFHLPSIIINLPSTFFTDPALSFLEPKTALLTPSAEALTLALKAGRTAAPAPPVGVEAPD
jgi:hypothetical protein